MLADFSCESKGYKPYVEIKGSKSWKSFGYPFQDKIGFGIYKSRLSSKGGGQKRNKYSPSKEDSCPSGEETLINTSWKFYLIK